jgi:hypothetical protein
MIYIILEVLFIFVVLCFVYSFWNDVEPDFGDERTSFQRKTTLFLSALVYLFIKYK